MGFSWFISFVHLLTTRDGGYGFWTIVVVFCEELAGIPARLP